MKTRILILLLLIQVIGLQGQVRLPNTTEDETFHVDDMWWVIDQSITTKHMLGSTMLIPLTDTADVLRTMIGDSTAQLRSEIGGESIWAYNDSYSAIYPTTVTDKLMIGTTAFDDYYSNMLSVNGPVLFTGDVRFTTASNVYIGVTGMYDGHLTFCDDYNSATTLSDILNQSSYWDLSGTALSPVSDSYTLNIGGGLGSASTYSFQVQGGDVLFYENLVVDGGLQVEEELFLGGLSSPVINYLGGLYHNSVDTTLKFYDDNSWRTLMMSGDNDFDFSVDSIHADEGAIDTIETSKVTFVPDTNTTATGSLTLDCGAYSTFEYTLTGNVMLDYENATSGTYIIALLQDGTGSRTVSFAADKWQSSGGGVTIDSGADELTILTCYYHTGKSRMVITDIGNLEDVE